ncbi:DUF1707 domain-containing protein [Stomatohabitans albus]|uniref:DUF1707 SHOCT-like domain-containing protein n=1 Tax=Stomatohabitans albus TaxID=3110766 RepID=UPI00300C667B
MADPNARIGDQERDSALQALSEHFAQGRLRLDEFEARTEQVIQSYTYKELDDVFADLPLPKYDSAIERYTPAQPPSNPRQASHPTKSRTPSLSRQRALFLLLGWVVLLLSFYMLGISYAWYALFAFAYLLVPLSKAIFGSPDDDWDDDDDRRRRQLKRAKRRHRRRRHYDDD